MKRLLSLLLILIFSLGAQIMLAQDTGDTEETDGPQTTVQIFFVACEDLGVMNLTGNAQTGFDIFYQIFNGSNGTGESLTSLRRANVDGEYAFSERISYSDGKRVAPLAIASARIIIAASDTPEDPVYETFVDDIQDGCNNAQNPLQSSDNAGDPVSLTSEVPEGIQSPDGGVLNPDVPFEPQTGVVLGPRIEQPLPERTANPGLVFALCDSFYPDSKPGLIYDTDNVRIFWFWMADTAELLQQNLSQTQYRVKLNQAPLDGVFTSSVTQRGDAYYVFYTATLGNLRPGYYEVEFKQDWAISITDGFDNFGPGSGIPYIRANCNFKVESNPTQAQVSYNGAYGPMSVPAHNFERAIVEQQIIREYLETRSNIGQREGGE